VVLSKRGAVRQAALAACALALACSDPSSPADLEILPSPAPVSVSEAPSGGLTVRWRDSSSDELGFDIERSEDSPTGSFTPLASVAADVTSYQDDQVDGVSAYCYRIRAVGPSGTEPSAYTSPACFQFAPPLPPSDLTSVATFGQIDLSWVDGSSNEGSFELWRSVDGPGGTFTLDVAVAAGVTSHSVTHLQDGTEYCFRVRAVGYRGQLSAFSNTSCATTPVPIVPPPAAPSNLVAIPSSPTTVALSWDDNASDEVGFEIWRSTTGPSGAYASLATRPADATGANDTGLAPSTEYCYEVRALGAATAPPSVFSAPACATTLPLPPPATPSGVTATSPSSTRIDVAWQDNAGDEGTYEVWRSTDGSGGTYALRATLAPDSETYGDVNLAPVTQYCYQVRATGTGGAPDSPLTSPVCATTEPPPPPATPSDLTVTAASSTRIDLTWQDNATDEAQYEVYRSTTGAGGSYTIRATLAANTEAYTDQGLTPAFQYCYKVRAHGDNGAPPSAYAGPVCATTNSLKSIRVVTFGDSNTNGCLDLPEGKSSYVGAVPRLLPTDPNLACHVAGKIEAKWAALRPEPIRAVNHGVGATTTGGGGHGLPDRAANSAPQARTVVNGVTRYEAEVLGMGYPWSGGESTNSNYPSGALVRVNAYTPGPDDFVYVSMGTNDANIKRNVTLEQTDSNLRWMAQRWVAAGRSPSHFMITTLAPRSDMTSPTAIRDRNLRIRALAAELGVHLIDLSGYVSNDDGLTWKSASLHIGDETHYVDSVRAWLADQVVTWMNAQTPPS
jgi:lysophospholipase L1-like esterase